MFKSLSTQLTHKFCVYNAMFFVLCKQISSVLILFIKLTITLYVKDWKVSLLFTREQMIPINLSPFLISSWNWELLLHFSNTFVTTVWVPHQFLMINLKMLQGESTQCSPEFWNLFQLVRIDAPELHRHEYQ
jgi:hypothetical protein